jgi:hypothetical protein
MKGKKIEWFFLPVIRPALAWVPEGGYERQKDRVVLFAFHTPRSLTDERAIAYVFLIY